MNSSLGESSKYPMSSISMQFSSSPAIIFFSEELLLFYETVTFLKIILEKENKLESQTYSLRFYFIFVSLALLKELH